MASPVDTSVKFFRSSMPGAPVLTGAAGTLISLLDACLVNGFGIQTASSVVVAGGVATATFPSNHAAAVGATVLVAGASDEALNGEGKVSAVGSNTCSWRTTAADGTKAGTITVKLAAAGFTKPFSGTNLAAYKSANPAAHGQYLRVADTGTNEARVVGYETMTAISTGTGIFPSASQISGGGYWGKSYDAGSDPVPWMLVSDGRTLYLHICTWGPYDATVPNGQFYTFGDLIPKRQAGDAFATLLTCWPVSNRHQSVGAYDMLDGSTEGTLNRFTPRARSGTGTSNTPFAVQPFNKTYYGQLPNIVSGNIPFSTIEVFELTAQFPRASLPGVYFANASKFESVFTRHQTFTEFSTGNTFAAAHFSPAANTSSDLYAAAIDLTGPWR